MQRALERHANGNVWLFLIILRPVYWHGEPLGKLQAANRMVFITGPEWYDLDIALL